MIIKGETFAEVYKNILSKLIEKPNYKVSPRNENVYEDVNSGFQIMNPYKCLFENVRRSSQYRYIVGELLWYLSGDLRTDFISKYSKFWNKLLNPDDTVNSNYGELIFKEKYNPISFTQWQWAYESLVNDMYTRQAIMHFNMPKHQFIENKDFVCTMYGIFLIRNNQLHFTIHMRSNDVILGTPTDVPFFCLLQINMWHLLKQNKYPNLELGSYTHIANSLHLYERNIQLVKEMLENEFISKNLPNGCETVIDEKGNNNLIIDKKCCIKIETPFEEFIDYYLK